MHSRWRIGGDKGELDKHAGKHDLARTGNTETGVLPTLEDDFSGVEPDDQALQRIARVARQAHIRSLCADELDGDAFTYLWQWRDRYLSAVFTNPQPEKAFLM